MSPCFIVILLFLKGKWAIFFVISGLAGMAGEIIFSCAWHIVFKREFWVYLKEPILNRFSSWLNYIPWSLGGLLYLYFYHVFSFLPVGLNILAIGLIGMIFEYLYGRAMYLIFGKDLWLYQFKTVDHPRKWKFFINKKQGRLSLLSYPAFCLAAIYFLTVYRILEIFIYAD